MTTYNTQYDTAREEAKQRQKMQSLTAAAVANITAPKPELVLPDFDFDLNAPWITDDVRRMHDMARQYTAEIIAHRQGVAGITPHWLSLMGRSGAGKTFLGSQVVQHAKNAVRGKLDVQCWSWKKALDDMLNGEWGLMDWLKSRHVLMLDDIGAESTNKLYVPKLYELLEARVGKWTIITTNLSAREISDQMDTRITSRLVRGGSKVISLKQANDYCLEQFKINNM